MDRRSTQTPAGSRLTSLLAATFFLGLVFAALDIVLPLWLTGELGFSAADWARVRSLRMTGILVSVVLLGALSDRFGQRRLAWLSLTAGAAAFVALALGGPGAVWWLIPVIGGCISTAFVNMNTLTQTISTERQGAVNAAYRSTYAVTGILAPVAVTSLAVLLDGYPRVLLLCAGSMLLAALFLRRFPREQAAPFATLGEEFRSLLAGYAEALRQRDLMRFIGLSLCASAAASAVAAFAAIRFVRELGLTDRAFGGISAAAGGLVLGAVLLSGLILDRVPLKRFCLWASGGASVCAVVMGLSRSVGVSAVAFCLQTALAGALIAPISMWISRAAGSASQTSAFSVQKVMAGGISALAMLAMGWLEPRIGIRAVMGWSGGVGLLLSFGYAVLAEPPARLANGSRSVAE